MLLCDITSNFKDLTKFGSKIREVDTSHFELFVFILLYAFFYILYIFYMEHAHGKHGNMEDMEKTGDPLIFAPSVYIICISIYTYISNYSDCIQ